MKRSKKLKKSSQRNKTSKTSFIALWYKIRCFQNGVKIYSFLVC